MITVHENARDQVRRLMSEPNEAAPKAASFSVGVKGGGCSGLMYELTFDQRDEQEGDQTFEDNGVKVVVDRKSFPLPRRHRAAVFWRVEWKGVCIPQPQRQQNLWLR